MNMEKLYAKLKFGKKAIKTAIKKLEYSTLFIHLFMLF